MALWRACASFTRLRVSGWWGGLRYWFNLLYLCASGSGGLCRILSLRAGCFSRGGKWEAWRVCLSGLWCLGLCVCWWYTCVAKPLLFSTLQL